MAEIEGIQPTSGPQAIGPYSPAIRSGNWIFCSGQIPLNSEGVILGESASEQTLQVLKNMEEVLAAAGSNLQHVVKTTIYLKSMDDFQAVNTVYGEAFKEHKPARATVEVSRLPKDVLVEIDCIALRKES